MAKQHIKLRSKQMFNEFLIKSTINWLFFVLLFSIFCFSFAIYRFQSIMYVNLYYYSIQLHCLPSLLLNHNFKPNFVLKTKKGKLVTKYCHNKALTLNIYIRLDRVHACDSNNDTIRENHFTYTQRTFRLQYIKNRKKTTTYIACTKHIHIIHDFDFDFHFKSTTCMCFYDKHKPTCMCDLLEYLGHNPKEKTRRNRKTNKRRRKKALHQKKKKTVPLDLKSKKIGVMIW